MRQLEQNPLSTWTSSMYLTDQSNLQAKVVPCLLAGSPGNSPQANVEGNSPSSQGHPSAAGSPFSPASSPEWHSTPRWPQYANFGAHSTRPAQPSTLSHVTSAAEGTPLDDTAAQDNEARFCTEISSYSSKKPTCNNLLQMLPQCMCSLHSAACGLSGEV